MPRTAPLVALSALLLTASLAPLVAASDATADAPDVLVVGFHSLPDEARAGSYSGERVERVDEVLRFAVVQAAAARGFEERAQRDPNVRYVQREVYAEAAGVPNDPYWAQQFGWARVNAPAAWNVTIGTSNVIVAVVDTGLDRAHADLQGGRVLPGYDFMNRDPDPNDDCGHGTGVTGVVGATTNNALGVAGGAQVSIMPLKALGMNPDGKCYGPFSAVASSIRYAADNGARVISMSLGALGTYDQATNDAIEYAWSKGALLVASAGNNGACTNCVSWPAAQPRVIAVSATDSANALAYFSSTGPEVEIAAPGKSIYTLYRNNLYGLMSGTSLAAPHVSAGLGLALSANPALSNLELRSKLQQTARDLGSAGRDASFGYGLLDMAALVGSVGGSTPPAPNAPPVASFTVTASGLVASATANASYDPDGTIVDHRWSWGDGIALSSGACPWSGHTYAAAGTYTITLTVTDDKGATASTTRTMTLSAPANQPPVARIATSAAGLTLTADGSSSTDPDGSIASWDWSWGDGTTGAGPTATHTYAAAGTYTVTLTVTDDKGATATTAVSVTVTSPAPAPSPKMHVGDITGDARRAGKVERLTWNVLVVDAPGAALPGATVTATVGGISMQAITSSTGWATFRYDVPKTPGVTYTLSVTNVALPGWTYDAAANVVTSRSVVTI